MPLSGMPGLIATQSPAASLHYPAPLATTGRIIFVNSTHPGNADDNVGSDPLRPKSTVVAAIRSLRSSGYSNRGDQIWCMPGHAETFRAAGALTMDVEGVEVFGMGKGASRPRMTFEGDVAASIAMSAANCGMYNVVGIGNIAGLTQPFDITGDDCHLAIEWQDTSAALSAARAVLATEVSRLDLHLTYRGFTSSQTVDGVRLNGCSHVNIDLDAYGTNSLAWVSMVTALSSNVLVTGRTYTHNVRDGSHNAIDSAGQSVWALDVYDLGVGVRMAGGSRVGVGPAYVTKAIVTQMLSDAGLLDVAESVERMRGDVRRVRFGLSVLTDTDLAELIEDDLAQVDVNI